MSNSREATPDDGDPNESQLLYPILTPLDDDDMSINHDILVPPPPSSPESQSDTDEDYLPPDQLHDITVDLPTLAHHDFEQVSRSHRPSRPKMENLLPRELFPPTSILTAADGFDEPSSKPPSRSTDTAYFSFSRQFEKPVNAPSIAKVTDNPPFSPVIQRSPACHHIKVESTLQPARQPIKVESTLQTLENNSPVVQPDTIQSSHVDTESSMKPYYVRSFDLVIESVIRRYAKVLRCDDINIVKLFQNEISDNARALFVRLYRRKSQTWFREESIKDGYEEINVVSGIEELCQHGLLNSTKFGGQVSGDAKIFFAKELLPTLQRSELQSVCASIVEGKKLRRLQKKKLLPELMEYLDSNCVSTESCKKYRQTTLTGLKPSECLAKAILKAAGDSVQVPEQVFKSLARVHFLFYLDAGHDSQAALLVDIGRRKYPSYVCEPDRTVFSSAEAYERFELAREIEQQLDEALEEKRFDDAAHWGSVAEVEVREFFEQVVTSETKHGFNRKEAEVQLQHPFFKRYSAEWAYVNACWHSVAALESLKEYEKAVSRLELLLSTGLLAKRRGKVLNRLTINLNHLGRQEESLKIVRDVFEASSPRLRFGDQIALAERGLNIHRKLHTSAVQNKASRLSRSKRKVEMKIEAMNCRPIELVSIAEKAKTRLFVRKVFGKAIAMMKGEKGRMRFMGRDGKEEVSVEEYCLEWYGLKEGFVGIHDEGASIRFLFSLLFWESALFVGVPDVFQTPYQSRPLDLFTEAFYESRKDSIERRLAMVREMSCEQMHEEIIRLYKTYDGVMAVGCNWDKYSADDLAAIGAGLGPHVVAHCCKLLAQDYDYYASGLPDLTLWKVPDSSDPQSIKTKLVEVKSPRDNLSEKQRAWLIELVAQGAVSEVCKVVERVTSNNAEQSEHSSLNEVPLNDLQGMRKGKDKDKEKDH